MTRPAATPVRQAEDGVRLSVRLTPKAASDEVGEVVEMGEAAVLTARVRAIPDKGEANAALVKLIAKWLGLPQASVRLASGAKSRLKTIAIEGDPKALGERIARRLTPPRRP